MQFVMKMKKTIFKDCKQQILGGGGGVGILINDGWMVREDSQIAIKTFRILLPYTNEMITY